MSLLLFLLVVTTTGTVALLTSQSSFNLQLAAAPSGPNPPLFLPGPSGVAGSTGIASFTGTQWLDLNNPLDTASQTFYNQMDKPQGVTSVDADRCRDAFSPDAGLVMVTPCCSVVCLLFSLNGWFLVTTLGVAQPFFSCSDAAFTSSASVLVQRTVSNQILLTTVDASGRLYGTCAGPSVVANQWTMLTFTIDAAAIIRVYSGGVLIAACHGLRMPVSVIRNKCAVGRTWLPAPTIDMPVSPSYFVGQLAAWQMWNRYLLESEILLLYTKPPTSIAPANFIVTGNPCGMFPTQTATISVRATISFGSTISLAITVTPPGAATFSTASLAFTSAVNTVPCTITAVSLPFTISFTTVGDTARFIAPNSFYVFQSSQSRHLFACVVAPCLDPISRFLLALCWLQILPVFSGSLLQR
jgi:hypothetical protein